MRPVPFLINVYLPEHYKNHKGITGKVIGKNLGLASRNGISAMQLCWYLFDDLRIGQKC